MTKIFWPPCARCVFSRSLLRCPVIELVLSEEYVTPLPQSNENASLTSLHTSCICCAVEPQLIFGMPSNDVAISPESLSTYLTKTVKNLSSSSLLYLHHWFTTASVGARVVFVRPHRYLFTMKTCS